MKTIPELIDLFSKILLIKMELHGSPHWLRKLAIREINQHKVLLGGIEHEVYRFDIKRNHISLVCEVLEEICPEHGPFSEKYFHFDVESDITGPVKKTHHQDAFLPKAYEKDVFSVTSAILSKNLTNSSHSNQSRSSQLNSIKKK